MGRKKRDASVEKSFEEIKEESLANLLKEKESIPQDIIDEFDVKPVSKTSMLGGNSLENFSGKSDYRDALKTAYEWLRKYNEENKGKSKATFVNYYPQSYLGRTVLMGINIKAMSNE